jgi:cytochrome c553
MPISACARTAFALFAACTFWSAAAAEAPATLQPGTMAARVAACTACHGEQGRAGADGYYPRLAGKPQEYLYQQLLNFRDGRRQYRPMQHLLASLPDDYLHEIAGYFASQHAPYPPPAPPAAAPDVLQAGRALALHGDAKRGLPSCAACHGAGLSGVLPGVPGLLGLPRDYLASQIGAWKNARRQAGAPDCMADVARKLAPEDIGALSAWLASQPVPPGYAPQAEGSVTPPATCAGLPGKAAPAAAQAPTPDEPLINRGRYLARIGNCAACHTAPGGKRYAGGTAIPTPFGTIYGPNITPDPGTGIGAWSADDFWQAVHNGKSRDGHLLYPAFPYTEYTRMTRADVDAIFAFLKTVPPVEQASREPELAFPYNQRPLMALWRLLYFQRGVLEPDPEQSAQWNRGRYLVMGAGHCAACHTPRNSLGATLSAAGLAGGLIPGLDWYAPPLAGDGAAGLLTWTPQDIAQLLKTGVGAHSTASGPMGEVAQGSSQYLSDADALAMGVYLKSLTGSPSWEPAKPAGETRVSPASMEIGRKLYTQYCAQCHQENGQGSGSDWPALAGNPTVTAPSPVNAIRMVLDGGFAPATQANPRPHGMPPFGQLLTDNDAALLVSFLRGSWGNAAAPVTSLEVKRARQASAR